MRRLFPLLSLSSCWAFVAACALPPPVDGPVPVGASSLARFDDEPPGAACPAGGVRVSVGVDMDDDGALSDEEVQGSTLLCNGAAGERRGADLLRLTPGSYGACADRPGLHRPGLLVEVGRDEDADLVLSAAEVRQSGHVCDGPAGEPGGAAAAAIEDAEACPTGGVRARVGFADEGGALDEGRVLVERELCHGEDGTTEGPSGAAGERVLVRVEDAPGECLLGGVRVLLGHDADGDGQLAAAEVSDSVVLCGAIPGSGAPLGPGGGSDEGSQATPGAVMVGRFDDLYDGHAGSVSALGESYYAFTTRADHGPMPHTLAFFGATGALSVQVLGEGGGSTARCDAELIGGHLVRVCGTAPLLPGETYAVRVSELDNVGSAYVLTVSVGANEGSAAAPVALDDATLASSGEVALGSSVRAGGLSTFRFLAPALDHYTVLLEDVDAPDGDPQLAWTLYAGEVGEDRRLASCADGGACVTPRLAAGEEMVLTVRAGRARPAAFRLRVLRGDALHDEIVLDEAFPFGSPAALVVEEPGAYSIWLSGAYALRLYDDPSAPLPLVDCSLQGSRSCLIPLDGPRRYYVRGSTHAADPVLYVTRSPGAEGTLADPVPLVVDAPRRGGTDPERYGDNGNAPTASFYTFTTGPAGVYSVVVEVEQPAPQTLLAGVYEGAHFADHVATGLLGIEGQSHRFVSLPLLAGTAYGLRVSSYDALTYTLRVEPGDGGLLPFPSGGETVPLDIPASESHWRTLEITGGLTPVDIALTGVSSRVTARVRAGGPAGAVVASHTFHSDGPTFFLLSPGPYAVELAAANAAESPQLTGTVHDVIPLLFGVPVSRAGLSPGTSHWYRFESAVLGTHTLSIIADGSGATGTAFRLYDDVGADRANRYSSGSLVNTPLPQTGTPLPPGTWLLRALNTHATLPLGYEITVNAP